MCFFLKKNNYFKITVLYLQVLEVTSKYIFAEDLISADVVLEKISERKELEVWSSLVMEYFTRANARIVE